MPRLFRLWPKGDDAFADDVRALRSLYEQGYAGCETRPKKVAAANEVFADAIGVAGGWPIGEDAARIFGIEDYGKGKLALNFLDVQALYPEALPGPPQLVGDCVSKSQANADLITVSCECIRGKPDEISGLIEGAPDIPLEGQANGAFASEYTYGFRGYSSQGWQCSLGAKTSTQQGVLVRKKYDGWDLTNYTRATVSRYGRRPPNERYRVIGRQHLIRTATRVTGVEQLRDFVAAGFGVTSCGGESFSSTRNEHGVCKRTRAGWSHAMAVASVDCRDKTVAKYGPLFLLQNSWGDYCVGPRRVRGTSVDIPKGSFWARWEDIKRRSFYAMSSAMGWEPKRLHRIKTRW